MEVAISAVTGDLVSRFISFLMNRYQSHVRADEKVERLQHLLMRAHAIVEEADGRYITNSGLLMQLKLLSDAMYRGYRVLDSLKHQLPDQDAATDDEVSGPYSLHPAIPLKRSRTFLCSSNSKQGKIPSLGLHATLESLEAAAANMAEFLVLLGGCERMSRRPYDAYLYMDSFMFGRHVEKQKLLNFLLQHNPPGAPAVLPIIGRLGIGKKTLVSHVCSDDRVRSMFPSIVHLNGDNFMRILEHERTMSGMTLAIVEFVRDIDDEDWKTFYSFVSSMSKASKVIIVSTIVRLVRFGSVKPIFLNKMSYEEFRYLFQNLVFGSADPTEHPRLVQVAEEFAKGLHYLGGSLVSANAFSHVMRKNLNAHTWLSILNRARRVVKKNLSLHGLNPRLCIEQGHRVDLTDFALHHANPFRILPWTSDEFTNIISMKKDLPKFTLEELLVDPTVTPKGEFNLLTWESTIPPYTSFSHLGSTYSQDVPEGIPHSGRKRGKAHT